MLRSGLAAQVVSVPPILHAVDIPSERHCVSRVGEVIYIAALDTRNFYVSAEQMKSISNAIAPIPSGNACWIVGRILFGSGSTGS